MKKLIIILSFLFCAVVSIAQGPVSNAPIVNRSGPANTVQDARSAAQYNFFIPRYADTTAANLNKGIDSSGAIIYTYDVKKFWYRSNSPKEWVLVGQGAGGGTNSNLGSGFRIAVQNTNNIKTLFN